MSVLHVVTRGSVLEVASGQLRCKLPDGSRKHVPCEQLSGVVMHGDVGFDADVCRLLSALSIPMVVADSRGRLLCSVLPPPLGNGRVRLAQAAVHLDPSRSLDVACRFISGKIRNQAVMLRRRSLPHDELMQLSARVMSAESVPELMGLEGHAARLYLPSIWSTLPDGFRCSVRTRRPPLDPPNALMGLLYAFLCSEVTLSLWACGLDGSVGYLHSLRSGKPALALDLMEEFRPILADVVMLGLFNRKVLDESSFLPIEIGRGVRLAPGAWPAVLAAWEQKLGSRVYHPAAGGEVTFRHVISLQCRRLVRHLLGDEPYEAYVVR